MILQEQDLMLPGMEMLMDKTHKHLVLTYLMASNLVQAILDHAQKWIPLQITNLMEQPVLLKHDLYA